MKSLKYNTLALVAGILASGLMGCSDFLETSPSTSVADSEVFKTVAGAQAALNDRMIMVCLPLCIFQICVVKIL